MEHQVVVDGKTQRAWSGRIEGNRYSILVHNSRIGSPAWDYEYEWPMTERDAAEFRWAFRHYGVERGLARTAVRSAVIRFPPEKGSTDGEQGGDSGRGLPEAAREDQERGRAGLVGDRVPGGVAADDGRRDGELADGRAGAADRGADNAGSLVSAETGAAEKAQWLLHEGRARIVAAGVCLVAGESGWHKVTAYADGVQCSCANHGRTCSHKLAAMVLWAETTQAV